jgi:signal transduction histidine kinase
MSLELGNSSDAGVDSSLLKRESVTRLLRPTWPMLILAFSALIGLIAFALISNLQRSRALNATLWQLNAGRQRSTDLLQTIRSNMQVSGITIRDYLLDPTVERASEYKDQLRTYRSDVTAALAELKAVSAEQQARILNLAQEIEAFWAAMDPLFGWTPAEKQARSFRFLRESVLPRRQKAIVLAGEIEKLDRLNLQAQEGRTRSSMSEFDDFQIRMAILCVLVSAGIATACIWKMRRVERFAAQQHAATCTAEAELRYLSQQLVSAQEEERRAISRELHDEVGQMLTGLRMDLVNLQQLHGGPRGEFDARVDQSRIVLDQTLTAVRDLAMGLRPSVLDDLGLAPALNWQAREFSRRYDVPVSVNINADLEYLSDGHRTAIYRVVQEALTNCARHSRARSIQVSIRQEQNALDVSIEDDGIGCGQRNGLGLLGMHERVRALGGSFSVLPRSPRGTIVRAVIPCTQEAIARA